MIYIMVAGGPFIVPGKARRLWAVFAAGQHAFNAKAGATGLTLKPAQMPPYATLALGFSRALPPSC